MNNNDFEKLIKSNLRISLILMTLVCLGPLLNLLFDYFVNSKKPSSFQMIITVITMLIFIIYLILYVKRAITK